MFLWNNPDVEEFNKLNDYTKTEILNAHNYNGSKVEFMIEQAGSEVVLPKEKEDTGAGESEAKAEVAKPQVEAKKPTVAKSKPSVSRPSVAPPMPEDADDVPFNTEE